MGSTVAVGSTVAAQAGDARRADEAEDATRVEVVVVFATGCGASERTCGTAAEEARACGVALRLVDAWDAPELVARWRITALPTVVVVRDGEVVARLAGARRPAVLRRLLRQTVPARPAVAAPARARHPTQAG